MAPMDLAVIARVFVLAVSLNSLSCLALSISVDTVAPTPTPNGGYGLSHLDPAKKSGSEMGPIQNDDALFLYSLVQEMRMKSILEVGGLSAFSAQNFLAAMRDANVTGGGKLATVDITKVKEQQDNHLTLQKDAATLTAADLKGFAVLDLVFFDCHNLTAQMILYSQLEKQSMIDEHTIIALHDTNTVPDGDRSKDGDSSSWEDMSPDDKDLINKYRVDDEHIDGNVHQWVERVMVNLFVEKFAYSCMALHPRKEAYDDDFPRRFGLTVCQKFQLPKIGGMTRAKGREDGRTAPSGGHVLQGGRAVGGDGG